MAVYSFMTGTYARNIFLYGNRSFSSISTEYHEPVKEYAAQTYSLEQIDDAIKQGWITEKEYNDTLNYIPLIETPTE